MDPITLIVTALATGAAVGMKDTAASAVKDAYNSLKALARKRLAGQRDGEFVLARHEETPETWRAPLAAELRAVSAADDRSLVAAAQAFMSLIDEEGSRAGKYTIHAQGARGVQVGDHGVQLNIFDTSPDR